MLPEAMPQTDITKSKGYIARTTLLTTEESRTIFLEGIIHALNDMADLTLFEAGQEVPVDTGKLRQSGHRTPVQVVEDKASVVVAYNMSYAATQEMGRRAGAAGPPLQPIYEWLVRKRGEAFARKWAWIIRQRIHERGIQGKFYLHKGWARARRQVQAKLPDLLRTHIRASFGRRAHVGKVTITYRPEE